MHMRHIKVKECMIWCLDVRKTSKNTCFSTFKCVSRTFFQKLDFHFSKPRPLIVKENPSSKKSKVPFLRGCGVYYGGGWWWWCVTSNSAVIQWYLGRFRKFQSPNSTLGLIIGLFILRGAGFTMCGCVCVCVCYNEFPCTKNQKTYFCKILSARLLTSVEGAWWSRFVSKIHL